MQGECQMNRKLLFFAMFVLLIVLSVLTIIAVAKTDLAQFEVINKSGQPVSISLLNDNTFYYLTVAAGETKIFTVERLVYDHTVWSCDLSESGTLDLETYMKLTFMMKKKLKRLKLCGSTTTASSHPMWRDRLMRIF